LTDRVGTYRTPIIGGLGFAILTYALGLVSVFVLGLIAGMRGAGP
jgi:hypothetical protein